MGREQGNQPSLGEMIVSAEHRDDIEAKFRAGLEHSISIKFPKLQRAPANITPSQFKDRFRDQNLPVILTGKMDNWGAMKKWNFDYFAEVAGQAKIIVNHYAGAAEETTIAQLVKTINNAKEGDKTLYVQEWHALNEFPSFKEDLGHLDLKDYDFRIKLYGYELHTFWLGQKLSSTSLHKDINYLDTFLAQIVGRKSWIIFGPGAVVPQTSSGKLDIHRFFDKPNVPVFYDVLQPGEIMFLPAGWFHRIQLLDNCISIGMQTVDEKNLYLHMRERMQEFLPMILNADYIKKHHPTFHQITLRRCLGIAKSMGIDLTKLRL